MKAPKFLSKITSKIQQRNKPIYALILLALIIGVPMVINEAYKHGGGYVTLWGAKEVLAYYGSVLASGGTVIGVYFSIRAAHQNYQEDVRARVLPFLSITPLEKKATIDIMALLLNHSEEKNADSNDSKPPAVYEEYKLDQIYFIITSDEITARTSLDKRQQEIISQAGAILVQTSTGRQLQYIDYLSFPIEIGNVGNGTAVNLRIGFNHKSDKAPKYIRPRMLTQSQTVYIHLFSTEDFEKINGEYTLEFYYEDIYENKYVQKFSVVLGKDNNGKEYQSIELVGKQIHYTGDEPNANAGMDWEK